MPTPLYKLRPDRDLQCYFQQPTSIAALSGCSEHEFKVTGCWRQQFDWAVVEWNRDNVFEHPTLRNLPDGDLRSLVLTYEERRVNCLAIDSTVYDGLGWKYLRIWEESGGAEHLHWIPLRDQAVPMGSYQEPTAQFELQGSATPGDYVELAWLDQHFNYLMGPGDSLEAAAAGLAGFINAASLTAGASAEANGRSIILTYHGAPGGNGNRVGVYAGVHGANTETWYPESAMFSGGVSPERWQVTLDFGNLVDSNSQVVPTTNVRKLRWTWAADNQLHDFQRGEFAVEVTNWLVTGANLAYSVAGPGSRRIDDLSEFASYFGDWAEERGNYYGGTIRHSTHAGDHVDFKYTAPTSHHLYLGSRYLGSAGDISVHVDGIQQKFAHLDRPAEDTLVRLLIGDFSGGEEHVVVVSHAGPDNHPVYFDFLEIALPTQTLPTVRNDALSTLATDWDTDHSLALAPERAAWLVGTLGFRGRANHYAGAMWFYELQCLGNHYSSAIVQFAGTPVFGGSVELTISGSVITHPILIGDTPARLAKCFELLVTAGSSAVWAQANGSCLTITAHALGDQGNSISISASTTCETLLVTTSGPNLEGGENGKWITDLHAGQKLNRAVRDWSRSYFQALREMGIAVSAAFSMELRHGDDSLLAGIAQRYPSGPVWLNTPALQTNFGPESTAYWRDVYVEMANVMAEAGVTPYLQFGEVQWWYFADYSGMPFYDDYTKVRFAAAYGRPIGLVPSQHAAPGQFADECELLPLLIGEFTAAVMSGVRAAHPTARFEVLYPPDTNDTPLNRAINFPEAQWTPANLACLKTENFTYTGDRNLDKARNSIRVPADRGFPPSQSSHLVGIGDPTSPWAKEHDAARAQGVESVVLFALDQFCLIGYELPIDAGDRWAKYMGA